MAIPDLLYGIELERGVAVLMEGTVYGEFPTAFHWGPEALSNTAT